MDFFKKNLNCNNEVRSGHLLLAEPMLSDSNFQRTVILVCQHSSHEGSFGLVINRLSDFMIEELDSLLPIENNLYIGGPVQQNTLHFIHKFTDLKDAIHLGDGIYWGGDFEGIKQKGLIGKLTPQNCRFFLGYSGWGEHQLQEEVEHNSWVISSASLATIFDVPADQLWEKTLERMGGRFKMFTKFPVNPSMN